MKKGFCIIFCCITWLTYSQTIDIPVSALDAPFDYQGVFCNYIDAAIADGKNVSRSQLSNWANNGAVLKWLEHKGVQPSQKNVNYHYMRLQYVAFAKCENFRKYFHLLYDYDNIGNEEAEAQNRMFSIELHFLHKRGFKVLSTNYKAFEGIEQYKKNLEELDWIMFMSPKYLGNQKYRIRYFMFDTNGPNYPMDNANELMSVELELGEDGFTNFTYKENEANLLKAKKLHDNRFGVPPPPPPPPSTRGK